MSGGDGVQNDQARRIEASEATSEDAFMFDAAPVSLWLEDFSALRRQFDAWREAGVTCLRGHFAAAPERVDMCVRLVRILKVNRKTVTLLEASDARQAIDFLNKKLLGEERRNFADEFEQLWEGRGEFSTQATAVTFAGRKIDLEVKGIVMPGSERSWSRVMVAVEDVTERRASRRRLEESEAYSRALFDASPVSIWFEDGSRLLELFDRWRREGITSLREHVTAHPELLLQCAACLRIVDINPKTLDLYEARDLQEIEANLPSILGEHALTDMMDTFEELWSGKTEYVCQTVNYTMSGRRLDVQIWGRLLPGYEATWERFILVIEDVTERETARRKADASEAYARRLFEDSPVALWVHDWSGMKRRLDDLRLTGLDDFTGYLAENPDFIMQCVGDVRVLDVNLRAVELYKAPDKATLKAGLTRVLGMTAIDNVREVLIFLWDHRLVSQCEIVNYAFDGTLLHLHVQYSIFPGHEADWSLAQIALADISARKAAEAKLAFLSRHDSLTGLYNRACFGEILQRLEQSGPFPVTIVVVDLDGLKTVNDELGHAAGDGLLRRAGEILATAVEDVGMAARIGGDEFVLLMPGADERAGVAMMARLRHLAETTNLLSDSSPVSLSVGAATSQPGEMLHHVVQRADGSMYQAKRHYYANRTRDRRRDGNRESSEEFR